MYDCSKEFNKFYRKKVVLSAKEQNELREKRKLNVERLKEGLSAYNDEKSTNYKLVENRIQGSMAMHTTVQNDSNDYDIDIGIVFESDNIGELGALATRNVVANALKRKTKQFAEEPITKTSCVRLKYSSKGYHVDFAVFKRYKQFTWENEYTYEHSGSNWSVRGIKALEEWFNYAIKCKGDNLRKVIRLSKMFCKSRETWINMPSGLIQTVLCEEVINTNYERIDELFYYTMVSIVNRLNSSLEVAAPVDKGRALVTRDVDYQKMENWKNRLQSSLSKLEILFNPDCTYNDAINAWSLFFNHSYWTELETSSRSNSFTLTRSNNFVNTEEFIEDTYPIYEQYDVTIDCKVQGKGFSSMPIGNYLNKYKPRFGSFIPHNFTIKCKIEYTNCPAYDKILWKVLNVGEAAEKRNDIRGQIKDRGKDITEHSRFVGAHYIECYLIMDNICVAIGHVDVPIGEN